MEALGIFGVLFSLVLGLLAILLPFIIFGIHGRMVTMNKQLDKIIKLIEKKQ